MTTVPATPDGPSDTELISAVRHGRIEAYGQLYERHVRAARRLADQLTRSTTERDNLVSDAFTKVLGTLRAGGGPDTAFRAYLLTTVRNTLYERKYREKRLENHDDTGRFYSGAPFADLALKDLEKTFAAQAFASLPERWQTVLWHTEVEGESPATVGRMLALSPNGVSALAYRAREGLRRAYLQVHLQSRSSDACRAAANRFGAWTRGGLSKKEHAQVETHLRGCRECSAVAAELMDINSTLGSVIAPLIVGAPFVAGYLGLASGSTAAFGVSALSATGAAASAGGLSAATAGGLEASGKGGVVHTLFRTPGGQAGTAACAVVAVTAAAVAIMLSSDEGPNAPEVQPAVENPASVEPTTPPSTAANPTSNVAVPIVPPPPTFSQSQAPPQPVPPAPEMPPTLVSEPTAEPVLLPPPRHTPAPPAPARPGRPPASAPTEPPWIAVEVRVPVTLEEPIHIDLEHASVHVAQSHAHDGATVDTHVSLPTLTPHHISAEKEALPGRYLPDMSQLSRE